MLQETTHKFSYTLYVVFFFQMKPSMYEESISKVYLSYLKLIDAVKCTQERIKKNQWLIITSGRQAEKLKLPGYAFTVKGDDTVTRWSLPNHSAHIQPAV